MLRDSIAKFFKVDSLISHLTGYVETRIELLKVEAKEELAKGIANILVYVLLAFVFALVIIFISIALALVIGEHLGGFAGFAIIGGVYLIAGIALAYSRATLTRKAEKKLAVMLNKKKR